MRLCRFLLTLGLTTAGSSLKANNPIKSSFGNQLLGRSLSHASLGGALARLPDDEPGLEVADVVLEVDEPGLEVVEVEGLDGELPDLEVYDWLW